MFTGGGARALVTYGFQSFFVESTLLVICPWILL